MQQPGLSNQGDDEGGRNGHLMAQLPPTSSNEQPRPTQTELPDQPRMNSWEQQQQLRSLRLLTQNQHLLQSPSLFGSNTTPLLVSINLYGSSPGLLATTSALLGAPGGNALQQVLDQLRSDPFPQYYGVNSSTGNSRPIYSRPDDQPPKQETAIQTQQTVAKSSDDGNNFVSETSPFLAWRSDGEVAQSVAQSNRKKLKIDKIPKPEGILDESEMSQKTPPHHKQFLVRRQPQRDQPTSKRETQSHPSFVSEKEKKCCFPLPQFHQHRDSTVERKEGKEVVMESRNIPVNARSMAKYRKNWQLLYHRGVASSSIQNVNEFAAEMFRRGIVQDRERVASRMYRKINRLESPEHHLFPLATVNRESVAAACQGPPSTVNDTHDNSTPAETNSRAVVKESSLVDHHKRIDKKANNMKTIK